MTRLAVLILMLCAQAGVACAQSEARSDMPATIDSDAVANPPDLPPLGKWMIDRDGTVAHWLGEMVRGKRLHEPINVILVDDGAASAGDALQRLVAATSAAGYPVRFGHSTGYRGLIGGVLYDQLPRGRDDAFSNRIFEESNNHGRIFGPHLFGVSYVFIGAFSREQVNFLELPPHRYASFNQARDDLARRLAAATAFKAAGSVPLGNAIADNPEITTGDHDGRAVVLRAPAKAAIAPAQARPRRRN